MRNKMRITAPGCMHSVACFTRSNTLRATCVLDCTLSGCLCEMSGRAHIAEMHQARTSWYPDGLQVSKQVRQRISSLAASDERVTRPAVELAKSTPGTTFKFCASLYQDLSMRLFRIARRVAACQNKRTLDILGVLLVPLQTKIGRILFCTRRRAQALTVLDGYYFGFRHVCSK